MNRLSAIRLFAGFPLIPALKGNLMSASINTHYTIEYNDGVSYDLVYVMETGMTSRIHIICPPPENF